MVLEITIVVLLTVVNGFLAMSELAIVSAREARLKVLAERGSTGAETAMRLAGDPGRFLSSVQIGITLVGILSGAFSGATLGARLAGALADAGVSPALAQTLGVGGVVVAITYLSLIIGELVPKQLALRAPETVAARVAPSMRVISRVAAPLIWLLDRSGQLVLRLLGQGEPTEQVVTDEEVRMIISEAESAGTIHRAETEMIAGVMRIGDRTARGLMTPRGEVEIADAQMSRDELLALFRSSRHSRLPVRDGGPDEIVGVVATHDALAPAIEGTGFDLRELMRDAPVVRDGQSALEVIERLRQTPANMALVFDEYGHFEGIITPMDILETIAGEFLEVGEEPSVVIRDDGSMLVAGWLPADEFADRCRLELPDERGYETVAGLVLDVLGHIPAAGESFMLDGWRIEVVDLDGRRIDKLLVSRTGAATATG